MKKKEVCSATLGACVYELQKHLNLINKDVYKAVAIGHTGYNDVKKG